MTVKPIVVVMKTCLSFGTDFYTVSQMHEKMKQRGSTLNRSAIRHKLWKIEQVGHITRVDCIIPVVPTWQKGRPIKEICYRNKKSLESCASSQPSLRDKPGNQKATAADKMWKAARMLRRFTRNDLVTICGVTVENAQFFTKAYQKAGYLNKLATKGREGVWTLKKDPGPHRPYYKGE